MELPTWARRALFITAAIAAIPLSVGWYQCVSVRVDALLAPMRMRTSIFEAVSQSKAESITADGSAAAYSKLKVDIEDMGAANFLTWRAQQAKQTPPPAAIPFDTRVDKLPLKGTKQ